MNDKTIKQFITQYCKLYDVDEDDFTGDDVEYIEAVFYDYAKHGDLPDFMRTN